MNLTDSRKFVGTSFGITISASDLAEDASLASDDYVNRLTFQEAGHILREGGRLILGHRWKPGGIMHHLASKARDLRMWRGPAANTPQEPASIINVIAWPDGPPPDRDGTAKRLMEQGVLEIQSVGLEGVDLDGVDPDSDFGVFCRTRALTGMRKKITELADVRICLGGGSNKPKRRLSGVLEEAILTIQAEKPLYISSAIGGISRVICDAILRRRMSDSDRSHFVTPAPARAAMVKYRSLFPFPPAEGPCSIEDGAMDGWNALEYLRTLDLKRLAEISHLSPDEYINLLTTADINRALTMVMLGVTSLRAGVRR